jgi:pimeloyl-ACP methyl ester carboxylesterase
MGLVMADDAAADGFDVLPVAVTGAGPRESSASVLRRRSARPSRRAAIYVHCLGDRLVSEDVVDWFTSRGFHFYAADLREIGTVARPGPDSKSAAEDVGECVACLDAIIAYVRQADAVDTAVMCGHGTGALVAALWCHARRDSGPVDALILAGPDLGGGPSWRARARTARSRSPGELAPLVTGARRRVWHGLDIACPVLVMCPANGWDVPGGSGGLIGSKLLRMGRATLRLGQHMTWLKLEEGLPAQGGAGTPGRKRFFDELSRWLGAYLSGQIRDQLL